MAKRPTTAPAAPRASTRLTRRDPALDTQSLHERLPDFSMRQRLMRFNPLRLLSSQYLATSLENFTWGYRRDWALLASMMLERDDVLPGVSGKRKKDTAHREPEIHPYDDTPEAHRHQEILQDFWDNVQCVDSYDRNTRGGLRQLIYEMGFANDFRNACHHIVWRPQPGRLHALFEYVPPFFFENVWGVLQFIPDGVSTFGVPMPLQDWLVTAGDGLMLPASILYWYKINAFKDWQVFNEKFGVPGILGVTRGAPDSSAGNAMAQTVERFASDWAGVIYGWDGEENPLRIIESGHTGSLLPMQAITEYANQRFIELYRGSDLGTTSQKNATGASLQQDESRIIALDDAARISETLNSVEHTVLQWWFGPEVIPRAGIRLNVPKNEDLQLILTAVQTLTNFGAPFAINDILTRFGFSTPPQGADLLKPPAPNSPIAPHPSNSPHPAAANSALHRQLSHLLAQTTPERRATLRDQLHALTEVTHPTASSEALAHLLHTLPQQLALNTSQREEWETALGEVLNHTSGPPQSTSPEFIQINDFNPLEHRNRLGEWANNTDPDMPMDTPDARLGEHYRRATRQEIRRYDPEGGKQLFVTDDPHADVKYLVVDPNTHKVVKRGYTDQYDDFTQAIKWNRLAQFHRGYKGLMKRIHQEIDTKGKDYQKAMTFHLMHLTGMRIGGESGKGRVKTYGASSLRREHLTLDPDGKTVHFDFLGKNGHRQIHSLTDRRFYDYAKSRFAAGHERLFDHNASHANDFLHKITNGKYTSHIFRTYHATALAAYLLHKEGGMPRDEAKRALVEHNVLLKVGKELGNRDVTSRDEYIHPDVWQHGVPKSERDPIPDYKQMLDKTKMPPPKTTVADPRVVMPALKETRHPTSAPPAKTRRKR